jgi:hypothetical protein
MSAFSTSPQTRRPLKLQAGRAWTSKVRAVRICPNDFMELAES